MTSFIEQTESFLNDLHKKAAETHQALFHFEETLAPLRKADSVSEYIGTKANADKIFGALAESIRVSLHPIMRDETPERWSKITKFNVWFLGFTKGLKLLYTREITYDYNNADTCDRCAEGDYGRQGHLGFLVMTTQTALYSILRCCSLSASMKQCVDTIDRFVTKSDENTLIHEACENGNCMVGLTESDDCECDCYSNLEESWASLREACRDMFEKLCLEPIYTTEVFNRGLEPYVVHRSTSVDDQNGFCVVRTPSDETAEKARRVEEARKQREAVDKANREYAEKRRQRREQRRSSTTQKKMKISK